MSAKYRVLDLFSGIGGFALGLEAAGMETVAFCEVAKAPRALLAHHWPEVPCYDDVQTLTADRLAADGIAVDVLCGGFPCQDLSYAGKGAGLAGERSGLWFQIARILRELRDAGRPVRVVILENVSALLGRGLGVVLGDLAALGFDAEWDCIPASAVGAPHRRDRIWIVAYARGQQHEGFGDAFRRALASELPSAFLANTTCELRDGSRTIAEQDWRLEPANGCQAVAHAVSPRQPRSRKSWNAGHSAASGEGQAIDAFHGRERDQRTVKPRLGRMVDGVPVRLDLVHGGWGREPETPRVATGVKARSDRLHGLGNAVVPHIPEIIGRAIIQAEALQARAAA